MSDLESRDAGFRPRRRCVSRCRPSLSGARRWRRLGLPPRLRARASRSGWRPCSGTGTITSPCVAFRRCARPPAGLVTPGRTPRRAPENLLLTSSPVRRFFPPFSHHDDRLGCGSTSSRSAPAPRGLVRDSDERGLEHERPRRRGASEAERECLAELASTRALVSDRARVAEVPRPRRRRRAHAGAAGRRPPFRAARRRPGPARPRPPCRAPFFPRQPPRVRDAAVTSSEAGNGAAPAVRLVRRSSPDPSDPSDGSRDRPEFSFASPSRPRERARPLASESGRESGAFASSREEPERSTGVAPRAGTSVVPNAARRGLSFGPDERRGAAASKNPPSAASDPWRSSLRGGFVRGTTPRSSSLSRHLSRRQRPSSSGAARRLSADELGFLAALADERALVSTRASLAAERAVRGEASADPIAAQPAPSRVSWSADAAPANHHASPPAMMRGRGGAGAVVRSSWNPSPAKKTSGSPSSRGSPLARRKTPYSLSSRGESPTDAAERMSREHSRRMWRSLPEAFDATEENARAFSSRRDGDTGTTLASGGGGGAEDPASRSSFRSPARPAPPPSVLRRSAPPRSDGGDDFGVGDDLFRTGSPRTVAFAGRGVSIAGVVGGAGFGPRLGATRLSGSGRGRGSSSGSARSSARTESAPETGRRRMFQSPTTTRG